jgi:hypothetical protein
VVLDLIDAKANTFIGVVLAKDLAQQMTNAKLGLHLCRLLSQIGNGDGMVIADEGKL